MVIASLASFALTLPEARGIWLRAQRLDLAAPFGGGTDAVAAAVAHLGYVQIDTIAVIERCHHHILWSRIPTYQRGDLHRALSVDKTVFEYWTHALSYVPAADIRFFLPAMKRYREAPPSWFRSVGADEVRRVVERVRKEGALSIRDIDDDVLVEKDHAWASRKPSKRALQMAFYCGELTISARAGMVKTYELMDRHFGWERRPRAATEAQVVGYLLDRALRAQGVVSLDSICHLEVGRKAAMRALIETRVRRGSLVGVSIGAVEHWVRPEDMEVRAGAEMLHLLSPFDPLIIQRKRLRMLFGYEHRFEAYVPKEKRVFGYFALPVLLGDEIIAAIDLKADRAAGRLLIQRWSWVGGGSAAAHKALVEEALDRFGRFQFPVADPSGRAGR